MKRYILIVVNDIFIITAHFVNYQHTPFIIISLSLTKYLIGDNLFMEIFWSLFSCRINDKLNLTYRHVHVLWLYVYIFITNSALPYRKKWWWPFPTFLKKIEKHTIQECQFNARFFRVRKWLEMIFQFSGRVGDTSHTEETR